MRKEEKILLLFYQIEEWKERKKCLRLIIKNKKLKAFKYLTKTSCEPPTQKNCQISKQWSFLNSLCVLLLSRTFQNHFRMFQVEIYRNKTPFCQWINVANLKQLPSKLWIISNSRLEVKILLLRLTRVTIETCRKEERTATSLAAPLNFYFSWQFTADTLILNVVSLWEK